MHAVLYRFLLAAVGNLGDVMNREALRAYHVEAAAKLRSYANDDGLRDSDVKHYRKRAEFHDDCVATIDAMQPLHDHNDGLDDYRGAQ